MATTYELIKGETLASSAASYTFSAIPSTYTDLVLKMSARGSNAGVNNGIIIVLNNDTSSLYSYTFLRGNGTTAISSQGSNTANGYGDQTSGDTSTANTFGSAEFYFPSYTASQSKPFSVDSASENNATLAYRSAVANLYRSNTAISQIKIDANGTNWLAGSSFYLYGIKNS